jgi:hypothetical protein
MGPPAAPEEMEGTQPPEAVGPPATRPDGDGSRAPRRRHRLRFAGALLVFLGVLLGVGVLTTLMVFPDPLAVPRSELLRGWLIILGAVAAAGTLLMGVAAPRAGYRWFHGALFLVPVYGQVVFAPRVLWRSRSEAGQREKEPQVAPSVEAPVRARPDRPRDAEEVREEARTLAALLSGRHITLPEAEVSNGPAVPVAEAEPEAEREEAPAEAPPEQPTAEDAAVPMEAPDEPPASLPGRGRRMLVAAGLVLLIGWAVAVPVAGAWLLQQERARVERLSGRSAELSASVTALRTELSLLRAELGLLREELASLQEEVRAAR